MSVVLGQIVVNNCLKPIFLVLGQRKCGYYRASVK